MNVKFLNKSEFYWFSAFFLNLLAFFLLYLKIHPTEKTLTLHYNIFVGADLYGKGYNLYIVPFSGLLVNSINFYLFKKLYFSEIFYKNLLIVTSLLVQIILILALLFLFSVN